MRHWLSLHWKDLLWLFAFGLCSSGWCVLAGARTGVTFDEPFYIKAGLTNWRTGSSQLLMRAGTMTLPVDVQTLPIHLWERACGEQYQTESDLPKVLPIARAANLVFWWLLLVYAMRLGRTFGGDRGGRLAVALAACDPNLLGHASLATTDIASTACVLVFVYHYWHGFGSDWKRRVLVPGVCYALAVQAKVSGMVFGLDAMLVLGLWRMAADGQVAAPAGASWVGKLLHFWHAGYPLRRDCAWIALIGLALVFVYTGCDWQPDANFVRWSGKLPNETLRSVLVPVSHNLKVFTNAGNGLLYQVTHNLRGCDTYLLGQRHHGATSLYFPAALAMKLPLPVFALLGALLLTQPRKLLTPVGVLALLLLVQSLNYRVQIGVRFMFPMVVLTYVAMGAAAANGWGGGAGRAVPRRFVTGVFLSLTATAVWVWPHGLIYFNQAWGGTEAGEHLLHDSNYDWGQGLPELREWCDERGVDRMAVWYYGTDPDVQIAPFVHVPLDRLPHGGDPNRLLAACGKSEYLAVSSGCFCLNEDITPGFRSTLAWVGTLTPVAHTNCFTIYKIR
jgi:hypothetical protein